MVWTCNPKYITTHLFDFFPPYEKYTPKEISLIFFEKKKGLYPISFGDIFWCIFFEKKNGEWFTTKNIRDISFGVFFIYGVDLYIYMLW